MTMEDDFLWQARKALDAGAREQITRTRRVDPMADTRKIVAIVICHTRERLTKYAHAHPEHEDIVRILIEDWLPEQQRRLTGR